MKFAHWRRCPKSRPAGRWPRAALRLEALENRLLPSTFTVTTTADSGPGSLRDAIAQVNADTSNTTTSPDVIEFRVTSGLDATGVATIRPLTPLDPVARPVTINGYTQAGASPNGNKPEDGDDAEIRVALDLSDAGSGLRLAGDNITVQGLAIGGGTDLEGSVVVTGANDVVAGNFIGTDVTGTRAAGNVRGVKLDGEGDTLGGTDPADRNVISGNVGAGPGWSGVWVRGHGITVAGNYIGTDASGEVALGNGPSDVHVQDGGANTIGGTTAGARNVIAGSAVGITLDQIEAGDVIQGNYIGTDATGTRAVGNAIGLDTHSVAHGGLVAGNVISGNGTGIALQTTVGIQIESNLIGTNATGDAAVGNTNGVYGIGNGYVIGGTEAGAGNIISGNGNGLRFAGSGEVVEGNFIGTDPNGTKAVGNYFGIYFEGSGTGSVVGGLIPEARNLISGNNSGIVLNQQTGDVIEGNYLGTDATGTTTTGSDGLALGNQGSGVTLWGNSTGNTVGGTTAAARNIISGSNYGFGGVGVALTGGATANLVEGNFLGTDMTGSYSADAGPDGVHGTPDDRTLWNYDDVYIEGANGNLVGGTAAGAGNVMAWAQLRAVEIKGDGNTVQGNFLGTRADGRALLTPARGPAAGGSGVYVESSGNLVGGTAAGAGNVIAGFGAGLAVHIVGGIGNTVEGNSMFANALGIDLGVDGPTANDSLGHTGPNHYQNYPVLTAVTATGGGTAVAGTLSSTPNTPFRIEFFASATAEPGQGQTLLGSVCVTTGPDGTAAISAPALAALPPGQNYVTATATNQSTGDTSEFAPAPNRPPSASAGGPYTVVEGMVLGLDGSASADPDGDRLTFAWTVNGHANAAAGVTPTLTWSQLQALGITDEGQFAVQVTVDDGHGHVVTSPATTLTVLDAPLTGAAVPVAGVSHQPLAAVLVATFTDPGNDGTVADYSATVDWADGDSTSGATIAPDAQVAGQFDVYATKAHPYAAGSFTIHVAVHDAGGSSAAIDSTAVIQNAPPTPVPGGPYTVQEGSALTLDGSASTDPDGDPLTYAWTVNGHALSDPSARPTLSWSQLAGLGVNDDGPSVVQLTVADGHNPAVTATTTLAVQEAPLAVTAVGLVATPAEPLTQVPVGSFTDPGGLGHAGDYLASVDWGDGSSSPGVIVPRPGDPTRFDVYATKANPYANTGSYPLHLMVEEADEPGTATTGTAAAKVQAVAVLPDPCGNGPMLVVGGTPGNDVIVVSPGAGGANAQGTDLNVSINGVARDYVAPAGSSFTRAVVYAGAGNDDVTVAGAITLPAWLYGGDGDDRLKGGNGPNVLIGGTGNDLIVGGNGRDLLVGDIGADRIIGNGGDDILIGGTTAYDANDAALCALMQEWNSADSFDTRVAKMTDSSAQYHLIKGQTVFDDSSVDTLTGSAGSDLFFAGTVDQVTDLNASDRLFALGV